MIFFKRRWANKTPLSDHQTSIAWYQATTSLFTPTEQLFLSSLEVALQEIPVKIFGKVRVADILKIRPGVTRGDYHKAMNQIATQEVDFLLVDSSTSAPLLVIQLEDNGSNTERSQNAGTFVDKVLYQAQIPVLHIPLRPRYNEAHLRSQIVAILK